MKQLRCIKFENHLKGTFFAGYLRCVLKGCYAVKFLFKLLKFYKIKKKLNFSFFSIKLQLFIGLTKAF